MRAAGLARALQELGRLVKTLYLLRYVDDGAYRRRILTQLNRHEGRHRLARARFHGKRGELRQRYREGQEDQLGSLGLVVNMVVLWNTIYMDAALDRLRAEGYEARPEDAARLSPLGHGHVNMLGRYAFTLPDTVARGELRPLRDPHAVGPDDPRAACVGSLLRCSSEPEPARPTPRQRSAPACSAPACSAPGDAYMLPDGGLSR